MATKEKRKDLYTVKKFAELKGVTPAAVYKMIKESRINILEVNGTTLVKL
jgi:predicted transcriptional regulator